MKKKKGLIEKVDENVPEIMFGIMSGAGLFFIVTSISIIIRIYSGISDNYSFAAFVLLFLFILVSTSIFYSRGWFRYIYLASALILFFASIYAKITGVS